MKIRIGIGQVKMATGQSITCEKNMEKANKYGNGIVELRPENGDGMMHGLGCCGNAYNFRFPQNFTRTNSIDVPTGALLSAFANETSSHGIIHIIFARGYLKKILWSILTITAVCLWLYHSVYLVQLYRNYDVSVSFEIETATTLEFPAVTICNQNPIRSSEVSDDTAIQDILHDTGATFVEPGNVNSNNNMLGSTKSVHSIRQELLAEHLATVDEDIKKQDGHQFNDFILECTYDGYTCDESSFIYMYNWYYGNCWTFNAGVNNSILTESETGPLYGLRIVVNVEQYEYSIITEKAGARVTVHDPAEYPFPEEKGIDIPPGTATSLGIEMANITRKGSPYSKCIDDKSCERNVFEELHPWTSYTLVGCQKTCYQHELIAACGCYDATIPSTGQAFSDLSLSDPTICSSKNQTHVDCESEIKEKFNNNALSCNQQCHEPCKQTRHHVTVSQSMWPSNAYKKTFFEKMNTTLNHTKHDIPTKDKEDILYDNFLQIQVYYQDLNYVGVTETSAYSEVQFLSDMGGAVGLYIGASILTLFEFLELICDFLGLSYKKCNNNNRKGEHRDTPVQKINNNVQCESCRL